MRYLVAGILLILAFGCIAPEELPEEGVPEEEMEESASAAPEIDVGKELIAVSGEGAVQVAKIRAVEEDGEWAFPLEEYKDEFVEAGVYSTVFIQLNSSHFSLFEEGESVWLTPLVQDGKGVLFNAVYSHDVEGCEADTVNIIGKEYGLEELGEMQDFENDRKWRVSLLHDGECVERVVIYMDGYYEDLGDNEQIRLFRNDNTLLFRFMDLESGPRVEVIVTEPVIN